MSTIRANAILDGAGGNTATINGKLPIASADVPGLLNASGTAPIYACRAWVNFNGTGTVAIRASGNVSSITDNGVGDYTVNFTTALPDANYSAQATCAGGYTNITSLAAGNFRFITQVNAGVFDSATVCVSVFR